MDKIFLQELDSVEKLPNDRVETAIKIYKRLCSADNIPPELRLRALISFIHKIPDEGMDMFLRLRDSIKFLTYTKKQDIIHIIFNLSLSDVISNTDIFYTGVTLYNLSYMNEAYSIFFYITNKKEVMLDIVTESCKYLFTSEDNRDEVLKTILLIIRDMKIKCKRRFHCIMDYSSYTGISMLLNSNKIQVSYDELFVKNLHIPFFLNGKNKMKYRLLSAKALLGMEILDIDERELSEDEILKIALNQENDINHRADCADILLRLSSTRNVQAQEIINEIAFHNSDDQLISSHLKTIYQNQENVHAVALEGIIPYFDYLLRRIRNIRPYYIIYEEIIDMLDKQNLNKEDRNIIDLSLNQINYDPSLLTERKFSLPTILSYIWEDIQRHTERDNLEKRLIEELKECYNTCSSGYFLRIINTLSSYRDINIGITFKDQIKSNVLGRVNAIIKKDNQADKLLLGMLKDAEKEDRDFYLEFMKIHIKEVREEMKKEFVEEEYINEKDFNEYFNEAEKVLL